jgi:hypothetical protein
LRSRWSRAHSWSRCLRARSSMRSQPNSRASCAVGVP